MSTARPDISIVIPALNEAALLPGLLESLSQQRQVTLECIVSDGGSDDGTQEAVRRISGTFPFPVAILEAERGRGKQLNRGASAATGRFLLFMHADCSLPDPASLRKGIDTLSAASAGDGPVAGKFALCFSRSTTENPFGYYYHESKARLLRRECSHGDQGILLSRTAFHLAGPFDESLSMLAETRFSDSIRMRGKLLLLPAEIHSSARRFETEGLRKRQTLNAIIMNFAALGWERFFHELPDIYPRQDQAGPLPLHIVLGRISRLMESLPVRERISLWTRTGGYVRQNAWQLAFACDTRRNFRSGLPPGTGPTPFLDLHDRFFDRLTDNPAGRVATALLVWVWFRASCCR